MKGEEEEGEGGKGLCMRKGVGGGGRSIFISRCFRNEVKWFSEEYGVER